MAETAINDGGVKRTRGPRVKTWASSEKRRRTVMMGVRLMEDEKARMDAEAARRGFSSAQEMVRHAFAPVLAGTTTT